MQIGASRPELASPSIGALNRATTDSQAVRGQENQSPVDSMPPLAASTAVDMDDFMAAWGSNDEAFDIDGSGTVDGRDLGMFLSSQTAAAEGDQQLQSLLDAWGTADPSWDFNGDGTVNGVDLGMYLQNPQGPAESSQMSVEGFAQFWGSSDPAYDLNGDGVVDGIDLGTWLAQSGEATDVEISEVERFMSAWGSDDPEFDFNGDGIVDGTDLGHLLGGGGQQDPIERNGAVPLDHLSRLTEKLLESTMGRLDVDGDGMIPASMFDIGGMEGIAAAFDADNDGMLSRDELRDVIMSRLEDLVNADGLADRSGIQAFVQKWYESFGSQGLQSDTIRSSNIARAAGIFNDSPDGAAFATANKVASTLEQLGHQGLPTNIAQILGQVASPGTQREAVLQQLLDRFPGGGVEATA